MQLTPHEQKRLLLSYAAEPARRRRVVRLPLPGGWVTTASGGELHHVVAEAATLDEPAARRVTP